MNDKQGVGPDAVGAVNAAVEMIDDDGELHVFKALQIPRIG